MKLTLFILFCLGTSISYGQDSISGKNYPELVNEKIHKFKISTNLLRPLMEFNNSPRHSGWALNIDFLSSSRDISIEPEYQLSNQFSIAIPLYFGLTKMNTETFSPTLYTQWSYIDSISIPKLEMNSINYERRLDLIAQIGLQGKWFPLGHEIKDNIQIYPFVSAGITLALYDIYSIDFEKTWEPNLTEMPTYLGYEHVPFLSVKSHRTGIFRGELLAGIELNIEKNWGLIFSIGASTKRNYTQEANDRIYSRIEGQEFVLIKEFAFTDELLSEPDAFLISRLQLMFSFGSKSK